MTEPTERPDAERFTCDHLSLAQRLLWGFVAVVFGVTTLAILFWPSARAYATDAPLLSLRTLSALAVDLLATGMAVHAFRRSRTRTTIDIDAAHIRIKTDRKDAAQFRWQDVTGISADGKRLFLEVPRLTKLDALKLSIDSEVPADAAPRVAVADLRRLTTDPEALFDSIARNYGQQVTGT